MRANGCPWDENACSPLFIAAENGDVAVVRAEIEAKADVNKWPSVYAAARNGHESVAKLLIEAK